MKEKITEQAKIESGNLLESANEIMNQCINCGYCRELSAIFRVIKEEQYSARGQAQILKEKILDKIVFEHNLSKAEEAVCPKGMEIDRAIRKAREALVLRGRGLKKDEEMINNLKRYGNPYGKKNSLNEGKDEEGQENSN